MALNISFLPPLTYILLYTSIIAPVLFILLKALYNLTLHPLAAYPGPLLSRASPFPHALRLYSGRGPLDVHALHEKYGPVVRIGPDHLSFVDATAWKDIYAYRHNPNLIREKVANRDEMKENPKSKTFYGRKPLVDRAGEDPPNILDADWEEHSRLRKAIQSGFSERAMRAQEPLITRYVDMFIQGLKKRAERGEKVDIVKWLNWTTFDVIGDLVFAEPFGCLEQEKGHPFVEIFTDLVGQASVFGALKYSGLASIGVVRWVVNTVVNLVVGDRLMAMNKMMGDKLQRRLEIKEERTDLFDGLMSKREQWNLSQPRLQANATIIAAAGSETTASLLSGAVFFLSHNPDVMERLKHEVRTSFSSAADITITSVNGLPYLLACLNEALRRYPPAVSNMVREVHQGGEMIAGRFIPEKTMIEIQHYAINHSSLNWRDPFAYRPERWLNKVDSTGGEHLENGGKDEDSDRLGAMQAFSVGPRDCVGRNLAYAEMRLILARFVFEFDWELSEKNNEWLEKNKVYNIWIKRPLLVHLSPVRHG